MPETLLPGEPRKASTPWETAVAGSDVEEAVREGIDFGPCSCLCDQRSGRLYPGHSSPRLTPSHISRGQESYSVRAYILSSQVVSHHTLHGLVDR